MCQWSGHALSNAELPMLELVDRTRIEGLIDAHLT